MQNPNNEKQIQILCKNIAFLRRENHLSKKEMAAILGIGVQSLTKLENGELPPHLRVDVIFHIYDRFRIHPQALVSQLLEAEQTNRK